MNDKNNTYLSIGDVCKRYSVSRSTIYKWMRKNNFPQSYKMGTRIFRWSLTDLVKWEEQKEGRKKKKKTQEEEKSNHFSIKDFLRLDRDSVVAAIQTWRVRRSSNKQ